MSNPKVVRCDVCGKNFIATAEVISGHYAKAHRSVITAQCIDQLLGAAAPLDSPLKRGHAKKPSSASAGAPKESQTAKELKGLGRTSPKSTLRKSSASKSRSKKKDVKIPNAKEKNERPLTKKQMLNQRFGPDNPEDYYSELKKRRLTLQGGSPGSGKRR